MPLPDWHIRRHGGFAAVYGCHKIGRANGVRQCEEFAIPETASAAVEACRRSDHVLHASKSLLVELRAVRADGFQFLIDGVGNIYHESTMPVALFCIKWVRNIHQMRNSIGACSVKSFVPLGELRIEPGCFADEMALVVVR